MVHSFRPRVSRYGVATACWLRARRSASSSCPRANLTRTARTLRRCHIEVDLQRGDGQVRVLQLRRLRGQREQLRDLASVRGAVRAGGRAVHRDRLRPYQRVCLPRLLRAPVRRELRGGLWGGMCLRHELCRVQGLHPDLSPWAVDVVHPSFQRRSSGVAYLQEPGWARYSYANPCEGG